tara:strand:- start:152 stop:523 length:372 start_codon:yes stop_codon:yes gene_type:complete
MHISGECHCGEVVFAIDLADPLGGMNRCNCSLCSKKGAVMVSVPMDTVTILRGADKLSLYQWNTKTAKHYFCSVCGIYTHHQRRARPDHYAVNVACFIDQSSIQDLSIGVLDGASNSLIDDDV